jgi:glucosyl-dolichyl phosphate glucuronosyltransferase
VIFLSVILPTRNRSGFLRKALDSVARQTYPTDMFEVIVIDNGSSDDTKAVCESYADYMRNLRYYYDETPGLHVGRHLGMKMAAAELLVYGDDDIIAFPTWLEGIAESFKDPRVALVGGKDLPDFETVPPSWIMHMWNAKKSDDSKNLGYLSILDLGDKIKPVNATDVYGCNFSVRKSVLLEAGGFHPDGMPQQLIRFRGDGESHISWFVEEKGYQTLYHPKASVFHLVPSDRMTVDYFCRRSFNQGVSDSFTDLRRAHRGTSSKKGKATMSRGLDRLKEDPYRFALRFFRRLMRACHSLFPTEQLVIEKRITSSYWKGYAFHQAEVRKDPQLLQWVLKDTYFD